jgi:hypothetical protein
MGVHLIRGHLMGIHLIGVYLVSGCPVGVYLRGVQLSGGAALGAKLLPGRNCSRTIMYVNCIQSFNFDFKSINRSKYALIVLMFLI